MAALPVLRLLLFSFCCRHADKSSAAIILDLGLPKMDGLSVLKRRVSAVVRTARDAKIADDLNVVLKQVIAAIDLDAQRRLVITSPPADPRFAEPVYTENSNSNIFAMQAPEKCM